VGSCIYTKKELKHKIDRATNEVKLKNRKLQESIDNFQILILNDSLFLITHTFLEGTL